MFDCLAMYNYKEVVLTLNSHEWPKQNFSLPYQHNIKQTSDENKVK